MSRRKGAASAAATPTPPELADPKPVINLMDALVTSLAAAPAPAPVKAKQTRVTPRRISAEVVKAETQLLALARRRAASLEHHERTWAQKRTELISGLPADVRAALVAMNILGPDAVDQTTNGAAAPVRDASEVASPPPAATAPAAAPAELPIDEIDVVELHETLAEVANEWSARGSGLLIRGWTEAERREALTWAIAVLHDGPMATQAKRPAHTFIALPKEAH